MTKKVRNLIIIIFSIIVVAFLSLTVYSIISIKSIYAAKQVYGDFFSQYLLAGYTKFSCIIGALFDVATLFHIVFTFNQKIKCGQKKERIIFNIVYTSLLLIGSLVTFFIFRYININKDKVACIAILATNCISILNLLIEIITNPNPKRKYRK